jgi:molybdopterin-containing oxidoreductase family membrane subunit
MDAFGAYWTGDPAERTLDIAYHARSAMFWITMGSNVFVPQIMWWRHARRSRAILFAVGIVVLIGMWTERFMIVVEGLSRDHIPSMWGTYSPTLTDIGILAGTFGFFLLLFLAFMRYLPLIPVSDLKEELVQ